MEQYLICEKFFPDSYMFFTQPNFMRKAVTLEIAEHVLSRYGHTQNGYTAEIILEEFPELKKE